MSYLTEKAAYINGLLEGSDLDLTTKEGKVLKAVVELMRDLTDEIDNMFDDIENLNLEMDEIDEALADVEDEVFGDCDCDDDEDDYDEWDFDDDDELAIECPHCGDMIYLDPSLLEESEDTITCPNCKEEIEIEFTDDCDCDDCDCDCD